MALLVASSESVMPSLDGAHAAVTLAQQLVASVATARVLLLTCGAVGTSGDHAASDASHGGVWGFGRVLRLEHAALRSGSMDVCRGASVPALRAFVSASTGTEMAWSTTCFEARLRTCVRVMMRAAAASDAHSACPSTSPC